MANAVKARTPTSRRRDFRLSPLETMILGLILVVAIYLISAWVRGGESPAPPPVTEVPGSQLERALAATEAVQAQISSLVKEIDALRQDMNSLNSEQGKGKPAPASLSKRLSQLERRVDKIAQDNQAAAPSANPDLTHRVEKLEKALSRVEKLSSSPPAKPSPVPEKKVSSKPAEKPSPQTSSATSHKPSTSEHAATGPPGSHKVTYKVRRGNTLMGVALQFKVKTTDILEWNPKLQKRKTLWVGEKLTIFPGPEYKP